MDDESPPLGSGDMTWIWIALLIVVLLLLFPLGFYLGKREGIRTERYVWEARIKMDAMPYSGLFYEDDPVEAAKLPPIQVRMKKNGMWGPK
jgi:hypothetical protein